MKINRGAIIKSVEQAFLRNDLPDFQPGDTVRVDYKVTEGARTRVQGFEGVERIFPFNTPLIDKVTVLERGKVRRAKLYYLRKLRGKAAKIKADRGRMAKATANAKAK